jgi:nucleoside-diphosphate-sugar epimerase
MAAFQSDAVEFVQADLAEDEHVSRVFRRESGTGFDLVVCCAAETGFGRDADRYTKVCCGFSAGTLHAYCNCCCGRRWTLPRSVVSAHSCVSPPCSLPSIYVPTLLTGRAALETGVRKFVYLSTAAVYKADKSPAKETGKLDAWTTPATHQLLAEQVPTFG